MDGPGEAVSNAQRERWLVQHAWALVSPSHAASVPQVLVTGGIAQGRICHLTNWDNPSHVARTNQLRRLMGLTSQLHVIGWSVYDLTRIN